MKFELGLFVYLVSWFLRFIRLFRYILSVMLSWVVIRGGELWFLRLGIYSFMNKWICR